MIFCCSVRSPAAHAALVAIFCLAALNSDLKTGAPADRIYVQRQNVPKVFAGRARYRGREIAIIDMRDLRKMN
ncbi:unnamed protein product [Merluccius merluccius]